MSTAHPHRPPRRRLVPRMVGLALGLAVLPALFAAAPNRKPHMLREAAQLIQLPDEAYGRLDDTAITALGLRLSDLLSRDGVVPSTRAEAKAVAPLLVAGAPRVLARDAADRWPVLVGQRSTGWRSWTVDWAQNAKVLAIDLRSGQAVQRLLHTSDKRQRTPEPSMGSPMPGDFDAATVSTGVRLYRPFETNPWPELASASALAVHVVAYDWRANPVVTELRPAPAVTPAAPLPAESPGVRAGSAGGAPAAAPFVPVLSVPAQVEAGAPLPARLALDVSSRDAPVVTRRSAGGIALDPAGAVWVAATVLLVRRDDGLSLQADLWIPAREVPGAAGTPTRAQADVQLDVRALWPGAPLRGLYQLYAFAGISAAGPRPFVVGQVEGAEQFHLGR